jgi:MinD-like ATPase involved in chromosome partitioning or flagellar assembly
MAISAGKGVDVLCGSQMNFSDNTLGYEDIKKVKTLIEDVYDYIIIDGRSGIENDEVLSLASVVEKNIIVTRPNKHDSEHFERLKESLDDEKASKLSAMIDKSVMVYNMLVEGAKYDTQYGSELVGSKNIFRISYDEKILDYLNGFNVGLSAHNKEAVEKLAEVVGEKTKEKRQSLLGINVSKVKSIFGSV